MKVFSLNSGIILLYREKHLIVKNLRNCTMCRECIREENGFSDNIELGKKRDHFICKNYNKSHN